MKQQPSADKVDCRSADGKHQLPQQYKPNKANILIFDAYIYDGLGKEWQNKLQETSDYQAQDDLSEILAIFLHITKEKSEGTLFLDVLFTLHLIGKECRGGFQEHSNSLVLAIGTCAYPMLLELF